MDGFNHSQAHYITMKSPLNPMKSPLNHHEITIESIESHSPTGSSLRSSAPGEKSHGDQQANDGYADIP